MSEQDRLKNELTNAITAALAREQKSSLRIASDYAVNFARTGDGDSKREFERNEAKAQGFEWSIKIAQDACRDFKLNDALI